MSEIPIDTQENTEYLDVCPLCQFVWFDTGEYERLPKAPVEAETPEPDKLTPQEKEAIAFAKIEALNKRMKDEKLGISVPDHWWELIPALFGMPIEYDNKELQHRPIATWLLSAIIISVSLIAFSDLKTAVENWGLVPANFLRHHGLTFVSSFLLHGGILHLVGNMYFLIVFGDNVEDVLGKSRFLLLILVAAIAGDIAHILADPSSTRPCIGASGGISAVIAYYALRFPRAHIGLLILFRWVRMKAFLLFLLWVAVQFFIAYMQLSGFSNVSAFAHLGGAAVGVIFWLFTRNE
jgi:membrane associated rhomboid family serine protease